MNKRICLSWIIHANALVISGKVYVAWKLKMLHDVALHDVIGAHQAYIQRIQRKKDLFIYGASHFASC